MKPNAPERPEQVARPRPAPAPAVPIIGGSDALAPAVAEAWPKAQAY
jgi:hypothetical protein